MTGNGHDGIISNAELVADRCGNNKGAYFFGDNSEIELQNPTSLATPQYTYALWAKSSRNPQSGEVLILCSIGSYGGDQNISNSNNSALNGPCIGWAGWGYNTTNNGPSECLNTLGRAPILNQWYHVVFTRDNYEKKLYIDGKLINTIKSYDDAYYGTGVLKAKIGTRNANGTQNHFNGAIDELRIYGRSLNADEVNALYNQQCQSIRIVSSMSICSGQSTVLTAQGISKNYSPTYQWKVDGVVTMEHDSTFNYTFPVKSTDYSSNVTVVVDYKLGCSASLQATDNVIMIVKDCTAPSSKCNQPVTILPSDFVCENNKGVFSAKGAEKSLGPMYQWQLDGVNMGVPTTDSTFIKTFVSQNVEYTVKVGVEVYYQNGCLNALPIRDEALVKVKKCPDPNRSNELYIPTAFTPNGDGINDTWELFNITANLEVFIYNRWGELIFYSYGYTTPWDGKRNGSALPIGMYAYRIKSSDGFVHTGSLMLTR